jgi:tRNA A37 threonylcarbamoyladenosine dehydratase
VDAVIDACDQVQAKAAMAAWARETKALFIACGAAGGKRLAHKVDVDDLANTTHDPLLAQLRYRLRKFHGAPKEGKQIGVACVFSREAVAPPDPSCAIERRRLAQLPWLRLGGERDRDLRPVRRRLGAGSHRQRESGKPTL